jgi:uncharacterized protein (TIGR02996 family)
MSSESDRKALYGALAHDPMDMLARLALADALDEIGSADAARLERDVALCVERMLIWPAMLSEQGAAWVRSVKGHYGVAADVQMALFVVTEAPTTNALANYDRHCLAPGAPVVGSPWAANDAPWLGRHDCRCVLVPPSSPVVALEGGKDREVLSAYVHPEGVAWLIR